MKYTLLPNTDIKVSKICLGTMTWGKQNTELEGHEQMNFAFEKGVNFFDTAELYPVPAEAETYGETERIIGTWFKKNNNRDKIILATKVAGRSGMDWFRGGETRLDKKNIEAAIEGSLKRLQTDYVDLYQLHWPDRPMNLFGGSINYEHIDQPSNEISEILESLNDLVKIGKIRYIGLSNETPWGTMKFLHHSNISSAPRVQSIQNAYNLLNRTFEMGGSEIAHREDVGLLAYSPLAQGYLTGKYRNNQLPKNSRLERLTKTNRKNIITRQ
mgnify:CR=1 FL=1